MSKDASNDNSEKIEKFESGERTLESTAEDAVVSDEKQLEVLGKTREFDNQYGISGLEIKAAKPGETYEEYRARVAKVESNRLEIIDSSINSSLDSNDIMTSSELVSIGGSNAKSMLEAVDRMKEGPEKDKARKTLKIAYGEIAKDKGVGSAGDESESGTGGSETQENKDTLSEDSELIAQRNFIPFRAVAAPDHDHPYRGKELTTISKKIPDSMFSDSYDAFPELEKAGISAVQACLLMKAIIGNELTNYDLIDLGEDKAAKSGKEANSFGKVFTIAFGKMISVLGKSSETGPFGDLTIGFSQVAPNGVRTLSQELQTDYLAGKRSNNPLKQFLDAKNDEIINALEDPKKTPLFVTAVIAHNIRQYERHNIKPTLDNLGYGYNPDMCYRKSDIDHENPILKSEAKLKGLKDTKPAILPTGAIMDKSEHVKNIRRWIKFLSETKSN